MGIQCANSARAIELAPLHEPAAAVAQQPGAALEVAVADLGQRIAQAFAAQHTVIEEGLLRGRSAHAQHFQRVVVVLRNVAEVAIGRRNQGNGPRQRGRGHARAAVLPGNGDAPQAALAELLHLLPGQQAVAVARQAPGAMRAAKLRAASSASASLPMMWAGRAGGAAGAGWPPGVEARACSSWVDVCVMAVSSTGGGAAGRR
ncbi:hypothetical protein GY15_27085 [Delftia sp. 670]|nr:hypothetical protein GY15_27085 [Delftia sp. 670]